MEKILKYDPQNGSESFFCLRKIHGLQNRITAMCSFHFFPVGDLKEGHFKHGVLGRGRSFLKYVGPKGFNIN